ncbi:MULTISPECIES: DsrE family protein [Acinetobacter]|uniref:Uncharacterized protein n=3 Tax=Acinetobacter TaxID=469 RepID=A0A365PFW1_ACIJU|nr:MULTISPECIES: DsrE family protein [Acinetobacter]ENU84127.1 hypothetical protein F974_00825 [Acinetobacter sp. CIP 102159]ENX25013.1 hypothetical protein F893_00384 [Acinetobacter sp. CIP 102136]ENX64123.1 hypothetical protein F884_01798 [Acinetobacter sp. CIP 102143]EPG35726.1 hypothetical protein F907_03104 [Acinetobacter colistiniresistens]MCJ0830554.1 DsrE family protein [Acinetobacter sp. NIPH1876]
MKNIFFVLACGPRESRTLAALEMAKVFLDKGLQVNIFLIGNGIYNAIQTQSIKNHIIRLRKLIAQGATVSTCVNMAKFSGLDESNVQEGIQIENMMTFAEQYNMADRIIFFGGDSK